MLNLKNIRKTMSVLCAAACMLWTVPFASSADVNYTHTQTDYSTISEKASQNLILGKLPFEYYNYNGYGDPGWTTALTDGTETHKDCWISDGGAIIYRLDGPHNITGFGLWGGNSGLPESFKIYVGQTVDQVKENIAAGNGVYAWNSAEDTSVNSHLINYNVGAELTDVLYVALQCTASNNGRYSEFAVFGTASTREFVDTSLKKESISKLADGNLLRGLTPCGYYNYNGHPSVTIPTLTDGTDAKGAEGNDLYIGTTTGGIVYKLPFASNITSVALWDQNYDLPNSYDVYVSQNSDVFTSGEMVFSWDASTNTSSYGQMKYFAEAKENVLYVGYLFHCETGCYGIARISELAVYGSEADCVIENLTVTNTEIAANHSNSLIGGKLPMAEYTDNGASFSDIGGYKNVTTVSGSKNWDTVLTDGVTEGNSSHADIYDAKNVKLVYQLDKVSEITGFEMWQNNLSDSNLQTSYEVYVGDAPDTIFNTQPVYTYNVGDERKPMGQSVTFSGASRIKGSYVAVRFLSTVTDNAARISEIAFYGNATEVSTGPKVATLSSAKITISDSLISGKTPVDKDITSGDVGILTDGNTVNCDFAGNYVTYQLDAVSSISRFSFVSGNTGLTVGYEVYISNSFSSLYDEANKVFTWKRAYQPISLTQTVTFEEESLPEGKYIGVKFTEKPGYDTARIMEISVEGTALTLPGDLTGNGVVDILDLVRFKKFAAGETEEINFDALDVDQDGDYDLAVDMVALKKILLGI